MANTDTLTYSAQIPAPHIAREVTVHLSITGMKAWRIRLWVAAKVFALGAWIAGTQIEMDFD